MSVLSIGREQGNSYMKNSYIISPLLTIAIIICIILPPLTAFSESTNKSIFAQIFYKVGFPAFDSAGKGSIDFITIYDDNNVRVIIPNDSNGISS
jgi:hypothetical protein